MCLTSEPTNLITVQQARMFFCIRDEDPEGWVNLFRAIAVANGWQRVVHCDQQLKALFLVAHSLPSSVIIQCPLSPKPRTTLELWPQSRRHRWEPVNTSSVPCYSPSLGICCKLSIIYVIQDFKKDKRGLGNHSKVERAKTKPKQKNTRN